MLCSAWRVGRGSALLLEFPPNCLRPACLCCQPVCSCWTEARFRAFGLHTSQIRFSIVLVQILKSFIHIGEEPLGQEAMCLCRAASRSGQDVPLCSDDALTCILVLNCILALPSVMYRRRTYRGGGGGYLNECKMRPTAWGWGGRDGWNVT